MGISVPDRKKLWGRSHNQCAFPSCLNELTGPLDGADGEPGDAVLAEEAHIRSARPDGPRYDPEYPKSKLDTYANLILLCAHHHTMVDKNNGTGYSVRLLEEMRQQHEKQIRKSEELSSQILAYLGDQYDNDDKIRFEAVDINGLQLEKLFVDVPIARRITAAGGEFLAELQAAKPGDLATLQLPPDFAAAGAAQAILHPGWHGHGVMVGGPGGGKSTLLQFLCQYHRARLLGRDQYLGAFQHLEPLTELARIPIRLDLRAYAEWSKPASKANRGGTPPAPRASLEEYIASHIREHSGGGRFNVEDLAVLLATRPVLLALDGLDEVASLEVREQVAEAIVKTQVRLDAMAGNLVILVTSRPGATTGRLWSSPEFPQYLIQRLTPGLRLQYLQAWAKQAGLRQDKTERLEGHLLQHERLPHIRELASNPMQLAILLYLLHKRGLLPQQRTELYKSYVETFFDREDDKEPLVKEERDLVEDVHAYLGWYLQVQTELGDSSGSISREELARLLRTYLEDHEQGRTLAQRIADAFTQRMVCLVGAETDEIEFEVQSLREYFAARFIYDHAPINGPVGGPRNTRDDCLNALLERPYWSNVLRFLVGMLSKGEQRGLASNLRALREQRDLAILPLSRSTAVQLLDDRIFIAVGTGPIQDMVDAALDGTGVILGEAGLIDPSGTPFTFSEGAGRTQAVAHLKGRLLVETHPAIGRALSRALRRNADAMELREWWWGPPQRQQSSQWLVTAGDLGVLGAMSEEEEEHVAGCSVPTDHGDPTILECLALGGASPRTDVLIRRCLDELADGFTLPGRYVSVASSLTTLRRAARRASDPRRPLEPQGGFGGSFKRRNRTRTRAGRHISSTLLQAQEALNGPLSAEHDWATADTWVAALDAIHALWGDSWILRRAVVNAPLGTGGRPPSVPPTPTDCSAGWRPLAAWVAQAYEHRQDPKWWLDSAAAPDDTLANRTWLLALLKYAQHDAFVGAAQVADPAIAGLTPNQASAMYEALEDHLVQGGRRLDLRNDLRLKAISVSPRTAVLLQLVTHDSTFDALRELVQPGLEDLVRDGLLTNRNLRASVSKARIRAQDLSSERGSRTDNALEGVVLTGLSNTLARRVLEKPQEWPNLMIVDAAQRLAQKATADRSSLGTVARQQDWFPDLPV